MAVAARAIVQITRPQASRPLKVRVGSGMGLLLDLLDGDGGAGTGAVRCFTDRRLSQSLLQVAHNRL